MPTRPISVYLSHLGIVNALGTTKHEVLCNLVDGKKNQIRKRYDLIVGQQVAVGSVEAELPSIERKFAQYDCRNNRLLLAALSQIKDTVEEAISSCGKDRVGVVLGSSTSGILEGEKAIQRLLKHGAFPENYYYKQQEMGSVAEFLAIYLGLESIAYTVSTACSSSAKVFASARNLIEMGICDAVITGGVDSVCQLTLNGFDALELLTDVSCNPFSKNRDGITIGEGAAVFLIMKDPSEIRLMGVGESSDGYHISSPDPTGFGAELAMKRALHDAQLRIDQIKYINLHGTGTEKNDKMESNVVNRLFGNQIPCSSTKPLTGHVLGAAGATEIGLCWLTLSSLNTGLNLPPHIWDGEQDQALSCLNFVGRGGQFEHAESSYFMSNSFAFGGNNTSVIIGREDNNP